MARVIAASTLWLVLATGGALRADTVTLVDGSEIAGQVLRETAGEVTIRSADGHVLTFQRTRVRAVRIASRARASRERPELREARGDDEGGVSARPVESRPRARPRTSPRRSDPSSPPRTRPGASAQKQRMRTLLAEIEAIQLEPWSAPESERVTEANAKAYRVVQSDGLVRMTDTRPEAPDGIASLWVHKQCGVDGQVIILGCFEWRRLHWHGEQRDWQAAHPGYSALSRDSRKTRSILSIAAEGRGACASNLAACAGQLRSANLDDARREEHLRDLERYAEEAAGDWGGASLLAELHVADADVERAASPAAKIRAAEQRRSLVRTLVDRFPADR